jgi:hypothetical protein
MSTRCQIQIEGNKALLYVHSDGYPAGILPLLLPFVEKFQKGRGDDAEYLAARLIQHLTNESDKGLAEFRAKWGDGGMGKSDPGFCFIGFGVDTELHGDIEFLYVVKKGGVVEVQKVKGWGENQSFQTLGTFKVGTPVKKAVKVCESEEG